MTERAFKGILILLALVGILLAFQGRAWAGIYIAYDSNPMMVLDGANCAGGVTEALRNNPGARIIFESAMGSAESTIGTWSGAASGVSEVLTSWINHPVNTWDTYAATGTSITAINSVDYASAYHNIATTPNGTLIFARFSFPTSGGAASAVVISNSASAPWTTSDWFHPGFYLVPGTVYAKYLTKRYDYLNFWSTVTDADPVNLVDVSAHALTSPGPNGCLLGPVTVRGSFDANKITKFKIIRPVSGTFFGWTRTGRVVWDSSVN